MDTLNDEKIKELKLTANRIRQSIISSLALAGSGHSAGPLGMTDIFTALFFHVLKYDVDNPNWEERDRLVLSNGHICPVLYATMAHAGLLPIEELETLRKLGTRLQGHPHREWLPYLETSSGPLGSGLSQAVGMSIGLRMGKKDALKNYVFALLSDGEQDCGQTWEAAMLAGKEKLYNLIAIIDRNNIQIDGFTEDVMPLEPFADKWRAFNWHVQEIGGHDFREIVSAIEEAKTVYGKPSVIIANTIPGKDVSFMERKFEWHGKPPTKEEAEIALGELKKIESNILQ